MNLKLIRKQYRFDGIFSELRDESGNLVAVTLEHAYPNDHGGFEPKIPVGVFTCVRGAHRLRGMAQDFLTFEITGVEGHSNLLFHWGNYNHDSEGCILVGKDEVQIQNVEMIEHSKDTFKNLMELQKDVDTFSLQVMA